MADEDREDTLNAPSNLEEQVTPAPDSSDTDTDDPQVKKQSDVDELRSKYEILEQRYKDAQGWGTKASQENALLKSQLDLVQSQIARNVSSETQAKEQEAFEREWKDKIDANPSEAINFFRGMAAELRESVRGESKAELDKIKAELAEAREMSDPAYQQHKETVDKLVSTYGLDRKTAISIATQELKAVKPATQQRAAVPGRTADGGGNAEPSGGNLSPVDAGMKEVWRMLGIKDPKVQANLRKA